MPDSLIIAPDGLVKVEPSRCIFCGRLAVCEDPARCKYCDRAYDAGAKAGTGMAGRYDCGRSGKSNAPPVIN